MAQSKKEKQITTQIFSLISFIAYRERELDPSVTQEIKECASFLKVRLEENPKSMAAHFAWGRLVDKLVDPQFKTKVKEINKLIMASNPSRKSRDYQIKPTKPLEEQSAKELLAQRSYSFCSKDSLEEIEAHENKQTQISDILKTKEHVLKAAQSKLIRKMSIHAGKKLSLREAQLLNNKVK